MKLVSILLLCFLGAGSVMSQTLTIELSGIRSEQGNIRLAFYSDAKSFDDEKPLFIRKIAKRNLINNGAFKIVYDDLKPGVYGVAILDDENANEKMDYGWFLPKEGFGFSDYYHSSMSQPKFESFDFVLKKETKKVAIRLRYL